MFLIGTAERDATRSAAALIVVSAKRERGGDASRTATLPKLT